MPNTTSSMLPRDKGSKRRRKGGQAHANQYKCAYSTYPANKVFSAEVREEQLSWKRWRWSQRRTNTVRPPGSPGST